MRLSLALIALLALPAPALAQESVAFTALGQPVTLPMPFPGRASPEPDYVETDPAGRAVLAEWVPQGENVQAWSQMLTLIAEHHRAARLPPPDLPGLAEAGIEELLGRYRAGCASAPQMTPLESPAPAGALAHRAALFTCAQVRGAEYGEAMVAISVAGARDQYSLQWAERFPAGAKAGAPALPWAERLAQLATARF